MQRMMIVQMLFQLTRLPTWHLLQRMQHQAEIIQIVEQVHLLISGIFILLLHLGMQYLIYAGALSIPVSQFMMLVVELFLPVMTIMGLLVQGLMEVSICQLVQEVITIFR